METMKRTWLTTTTIRSNVQGQSEMNDAYSIAKVGLGEGEGCVKEWGDCSMGSAKGDSEEEEKKRARVLVAGWGRQWRMRMREMRWGW